MTSSDFMRLGEIVVVPEIPSLGEKAVQGLLNSYALNLSSLESRGFALECFAHEIAQFGLLRSIASSQRVDYHFFKTDSSNAGAGLQVYEGFIAPELERRGFDEEKRIDIASSVQEVYVNSWMHGSKVGRQDDYDRRKEAVPTVLEHDRNVRTPIALETLITDDACLIRVIDKGHGFIQKNEVYDPMKSYGRGILFLRAYSDQHTFAHLDNGFAASFLKYKDTPTIN